MKKFEYSWRRKVWEEARAFWRTYKAYLLLAMWLLTLIFGYIGFSQYNASRGEGQTFSFSDNLFLALSLFVLGSGQSAGVGPFLEISRWMAAGVALTTVVQAIKVLFHEQIEVVRSRSSKEHVLIFGLGEMGLSLAKSFHKETEEGGAKVVVVEKQANNPALSTCRDLGIHVLIGDALEEQTLKKCAAERAKYLFAVMGQDSTNISLAALCIAKSKAKEEKKKSKQIARCIAKQTCVVHLKNDALRDLLEPHLYVESQSLRLILFNVSDSAARRLFCADEKKQTACEYSQVLDAQFPHLLLVGFDLLGQNLVVKAAQKSYAKTKRPVRFTIIAPDAAEEVKRLKQRNPSLCQSAEFCFHFYDTDDLRYERGDFLDGGASNIPYSAAFLCLPNDEITLLAALHLHKHWECKTPIVMCLSSKNGIDALLKHPASPNEKSHFPQLKSFYVLHETCTETLLSQSLNEMLASAIHEHYASSERKKGNKVPHWNELSKDKQESNRNAADRMMRFIAEVGYELQVLADFEAAAQFVFAPEEFESLACDEHEAWTKEREDADWTFGEPRDDVHKKHDLLKEWDKLTIEQRLKTYQQIEAYPEIFANAGYALVKSSATR